jgi:hypothetical protein
MTGLLDIDSNKPCPMVLCGLTAYSTKVSREFLTSFPQQKGMGNEKKPDFFSDSGIC